MPQEKAKITFYDINRCGYYKRGEDYPEFGDTKSLLINLKDWAKQNDMTLEQTCTYEIGDHKPEYRTFCFDLIVNPSNNSFLLTTWNELPSSSNKFAAVMGHDPVGRVKVNLTDVPKNSIPGYATYFWFIPCKDLIAAIQFQHNYNGRENMEAYMRGFLAKFSMNVVTSPKDHDTIVLGYKKDDDLSPDSSLSPQFKSMLHRRKGPVEYIRSNLKNIRKIIRKEIISFDLEDKRVFWQKALQRMGVSQPQVPDKASEKIKIEMNYSPLEDELEEMINFWQTNENIGDKWDDLGFKMEGETEIRWLSHCLAKSEFNLDLIRDNDEIINAESLLNQLALNESLILGILE
jgi:hypothetical protein